jgi:hypothetical protein
VQHLQDVRGLRGVREMCGGCEICTNIEIRATPSIAEANADKFDEM